MKKISAILLFAAATALAGCGSAANNSNLSNANLKGTNTNTGYVVNSETNAKPTIPANSTNIEPPSMSNMNHNTNTKPANSNVNKKP
jgi:hypothetical protein